MPALRRAAQPALLIAAAVFAVVACSEQRRLVAPRDVDPKVDVEASKVDAVMMVRNPSAPPGERGGSTLQLDASIRNPQGHELENKNEKHTTWLTTDPEVATVDSTGLVTAQGVGSVSIIVDHKKSSDTVRIRVIPVPVRTVTIAGLDSVSIDDTTTYVATTLDSVGVPLVGRAITFGTSLPAVASISATGEAIALSVGTTMISAESEGKSATLSLRVWLQPIARISIAPASIPVYRSVTATATLFDRRDKVLTGRGPVTWTSASEGVATVSAAGVLYGVDRGTSEIAATSEGFTGRITLSVTNPVEGRALWVNRFDFATAADIATIMQRAASANFNIVYFQARGAADALYTPNPANPLEPCSYRICGPPKSPFPGTMGGTPQRLDPLAIAITEANKYGIEVHAWLNALTGAVSGNATNCSILVASTPLNIVLAHPEWVMATITGARPTCLTSPEYLWVSPGIPEVRSHLAAVATDIARRYDVKGIHLDRIRYPGPTVSYDEPSVTTYRDQYGVNPTASNPNWANMRRGFVNATVKEVYDALMAVNPKLVLSAAIWPIYRPMPDWGTAYSKGYEDYFQDPRAWASGGYLDVAAPMTYPLAPSTTYTVKTPDCVLLSWTCLIDDHRRAIEGVAGRHVYAGVGAVNGWAEVERQVKKGRERQVTGFSMYNYTQMNTANGFALLKADLFKYPATIPPRTWK